MGEYTCVLEEIGSGSIPIVGGKGANLGELTRAGLPVPRAFVVNTLGIPARHVEANCASWPHPEFAGWARL